MWNETTREWRMVGQYFPLLFPPRWNDSFNENRIKLSKDTELIVLNVMSIRWAMITKNI